jgi:hypothetical protein
MNTHLHRYEEIESYLQGSHQNPEAFEQELINNQSLREEVNLHRSLADLLKNKDKNELRSTLVAISKDFETEAINQIAPASAVVRNIGTYRKQIFSIAAGLAAVLCGIWFLKPNVPINAEITNVPIPEKNIEIQMPTTESTKTNAETIETKKEKEDFTPPKGQQTLSNQPNELTAEAGQTKTEPVSASTLLENVTFDKTLLLDENGRIDLDFYAEISDNQTTVEDFKFELIEKGTENKAEKTPIFSKTKQSEFKKPLGFASKKPLIHSFEMQTKAILKAGFYEIKVKNKAGKVVYAGNVEVKNQ